MATDDRRPSCAAGCVAPAIGAVVGCVLTLVWGFSGGVRWLERVLICSYNPDQGGRCGDGIQLLLPGALIAAVVAIMCAVAATLLTRLVRRFLSRKQ